MVFIEGVGYVNDSSAVATPNHTQSVSETTANFDGMLRTETDKLNQASVTTNLDSIFKEAADKYGVSERLLKAIAYTESGFQADVTSFSGAMGIMQLMPSTASAYGVSDPLRCLPEYHGRCSRAEGSSEYVPGKSVACNRRL
ncbi:MAG: transglycosylase SLT domain-containing protein [Coprococcus sp.]